MSKMISMIAALVLGVALAVPISASATVGKPFLHGVTSPADLANKIQASLKKNPKGTSMLDPDRCKRDGSCATPLNYLEALQKVNSGAHLTHVSEIHDYLRTLQVVDAPVGKYWISCLKPSGRGTYQAEIHCLERSFKKDEKAWIDPKTNIIVFASDCTNVVEKLVSPKQVCAEIHFFARTSDTVARNAVLGPTAIKDDCFAIKKVGETEFHSPWKDDCASEFCTFVESEMFLKKKAWMLASYELEQGEYILRVPTSFAEKNSQYVTVLCLERSSKNWRPAYPTQGASKEEIARYTAERNQWIDGNSDSVNVWPNAYRVNNSGIPVATVYYTEAEVPATEPVKMYWRWGVWVREQEAKQQR